MTAPGAAPPAPTSPAAAPVRRPRRSFRLRLTMAMVALGVIPALAIGGFGLHRYRTALERQARDEALIALDDLAQVADQELTDVAEQLDVVASLLERTDLPAGQRLQEAGTMLSAALTVSVVGIYDSSGQRQGALRKPGDDTPLPERLDPKAHPTQLADPARDFTVGLVVRTRTGARLPVLRAVRLPGESLTLLAPVAMSRLGERITRLADTRFAGALDSLVVLDTELRVVSSPDPERNGLPFPRPRWLQDKDLAVLRGNIVFRGQRTTGHEGAHLVAVRRLATTPLLFLAQIDEDRVLEPANHLRLVVLTGSALAAALAALLGILWSRRAAAPIARLVSFADALAARRFEERVQVASGDELETLGVAFNDAAAALAGSEAALASAAAIRVDLSRFLPAQLVDRVVRREHQLELGGQRHPVTVLFADVAGFTSLVERHSPEVVIPILNELFTLLTALIFRHRGTVDKFIGDCVMALWNAPDADEHHAASAVRCAQDMLRWVEAANEIWQRRVGVTIHLAIGVHTGEATVGNFGSATRMEYTAMGDTVNVAARLEHLARPQQILVGAATMKAAPTAATYVALGFTRLAGREQPVEIFEVIAE